MEFIGLKVIDSCPKRHKSNHEEMVDKLELRDSILTRLSLKKVSVMKEKERLRNRFRSKETTEGYLGDSVSCASLDFSSMISGS